MKTKLFISAILICGSTIFSACSDNNGVIPDATIVNAFNSKYPDAKNVEWETKADYKVAEFRNGSYETEAWFDASGKWMMTETDIPYNQLPQAIRMHFESSEYASWKKEDVDKLERANTATVYILEVEKGETEIDLYYAEDGALIKTIADGENTGHQPTVIPDAIQKFLTEHYPGATILEYDREQQGTEVDILDKGIHKEVKFNTLNEWTYTEWDIRLTDVPQTVTSALKASQYGSYEIDDIDVIEKSDRLFYVFELEQGNKEVIVTYTPDGQVWEE